MAIKAESFVFEGAEQSAEGEKKKEKRHFKEKKKGSSGNRTLDLAYPKGE